MRTLMLSIIYIAVVGCAHIPQKSMSWDQENLKRHDVGCPTAIFVAPGGNLEQC
jgi:hypothetical protein